METLDRTSEETEVCVKKEEMLELNISNHGNEVDTTAEVFSVKEEASDSKDFLCKSFHMSYV